MFNKLFKGKKEIQVLSPIEGKTIPVSQVKDPTFSEEILGKGIAIIPSAGRVVAPVNGEVSQMFETGHAVAIISEDGLEILIHIGLDTVNLKGKHFTSHVKSGTNVKEGDLLIEFDKDAIISEGYDVTTPVVICNSGDFKSIHTKTEINVKEKDEIMTVKK